MEQSVVASQDHDAADLRAVVLAFRHIGAPALQALQTSSTENAAAGQDFGRFDAIVQSAVGLSQELSDGLGAQQDSLDAWVRWSLLGASSQMASAYFQATGQVLPKDEIANLAQMAQKFQEKFKLQLTPSHEKAPNTAAAFRARLLEAMVPVVGAVARYSFGRAEHALLGEVADKIVKTADQLTRAMAAPGATVEEWRLLCWNIMRAAGQIYADAHYAEADRLLYMDADSRAAYFAQHGDKPPMKQVWQMFNQRMALLATLANYLDVPTGTEVEGAEGL